MVYFLKLLLITFSQADKSDSDHKLVAQGKPSPAALTSLPVCSELEDWMTRWPDMNKYHVIRRR